MKVDVEVDLARDARLGAELQALWEDRSLGGYDADARPAEAFIAGFLRAVEVLKVLKPDTLELWRLRLAKVCPNPDHPGGQVWCAYCGAVAGVDAAEWPDDE